MTMTLTSPVFNSNGPIPERFTCDVDDVSPPLNWSGIPDGSQSLVLMMDDPDAPDPKHPKMTWVHWLAYNLPVDSVGLEEAADRHLPAGTLTGLNDWKRTVYGGPCPPIGRHRYFFKLYALDTRLPDLNYPSETTLELAMQGHVLESCELVGMYGEG